ncbi:MAG: hypothetical protein N2C14_06300, partial [Planctomycetales bacterium]
GVGWNDSDYRRRSRHRKLRRSRRRMDAKRRVFNMDGPGELNWQTENISPFAVSLHCIPARLQISCTNMETSRFPPETPKLAETSPRTANA